jgi:DNA polymerase-3 subunit alpha
VTTPFVHLHVHSEFSLYDSIVRIRELVAAAREQEMPAVALTDMANLFGVVKFYRAAIAAGIKPIVGADVWLENPGDHHKPWRLVLLCQDLTGYRNLSRLLSRAFVDGQHSGRPCISKDWLAGATDGLIALSGAHEGDIGQALIAGNQRLAEELLHAYRSLFPDRFYLELQRTGQQYQEDYVHAAVRLAEQTGTPPVASNHVHFLKREDFDVHEARVCIQEGRVLSDPRRPRRYTEQQYFRGNEEMADTFADIPEALENSMEIARRCNLHLQFGTYFLPDFPVPQGLTIDELLRRESGEGLARRIATLEAAGESIDHKEYELRLARELDVIIEMGFPGYFLIVADFIQWAKDNDVPVGPGRGSGAGSLVAYALGITDLDPIRYELLFERFLNPERVSMPDFDVDFCMEKRDRVIEYVTERYGKDKVSQIITYGTMAAKAVVRDVGRVMDHPYGYVDKLAKLIPFEIGMTLDKALEQEPALKERYDNEEDVRELIDMARSLEGLARNAGKHAGGVVIAPTPLTDFMPLYCEQGGKQMVSQLDKDDLEALGLVKFDFLGLRNLTIIDKAVKIINAERARVGEAALQIDQLPIDDVPTYDLLKSCKTTALFQLESRGMKDLIQRLRPDQFEEIVALVALFRPGPLQSGMVDDFINRKHGRARIEYPHPSLEAILKPTYGVILYQEQVMQIAQVLSGYTLGGADLLRRAMGKKKPEEMAKQRDVFVSGASDRGVNPKLASDIFDLIEKFAGYGFNRSHSAAYALIAYQTAWLKAHYPAAFMAAVLSSDMDHTDKVVTMLAECRDMGLEVTAPEINRCGYEFLPVEGTTILYGIGAIKGIGESAIEAILQAREEGGPFTDLFDLCARIDLRRVNKRVLESLIRSGALDSLGSHRASLMATLATALQAAGQHSKDREAGQHDLFGAAEVKAPVHGFVDVPEWSEEQRLEGEKDTLGLYLSGHPIARFEQELARMTTATIAALDGRSEHATVAGLVVGLRTMQTRRGDRMAFVTLDDRTGRIELAVFADLYAGAREQLAKDSLVVVEGQLSVDEYTGGFKMRADRIYNMDEARSEFASRLVIDVDADRAGNGFVSELKQILEPAGGGKCPVYIHYRTGAAEAEIVLGADWTIQPSTQILERLADLAGEDRVHLMYRD